MEIVLAVLLLFGGFTLGSITSGSTTSGYMTSDKTGGDQSEITSSYVGAVTPSVETLPVQRDDSRLDCSEKRVVYRDLTAPYTTEAEHYSTPGSDSPND